MRMTPFHAPSPDACSSTPRISDFGRNTSWKALEWNLSVLSVSGIELETERSGRSQELGVDSWMPLGRDLTRTDEFSSDEHFKSIHLLDTKRII